MTTPLHMRMIGPALLVLAGCAAAESPELACQQRLIAAGRTAEPAADQAKADPFNNLAYAALDRTGCTARQSAAIERLVAITAALPALMSDNERLSHSRDDAVQMAAFQRMNDALIETNALTRGAQADLDRMLANGPR